MSRSGNVWDNAAMESFFSSLKTERAETQGNIIRHWAANTDDKVRKVPLPDVRKALLTRFPSLEQVAEVVPAVVWDTCRRLTGSGLSGSICRGGRVSCWELQWITWRLRGSRRSRCMMP